MRLDEPGHGDVGVTIYRRIRDFAVFLGDPPSGIRGRTRKMSVTYIAIVKLIGEASATDRRRSDSCERF
jgi:peptide subunit release factor RF-3